MVAGSGSAAGAALPADRIVVSRWTRLLENQRVLAVALLAPGVIILTIFIAYPFVMAIWFALTDLSVGAVGKFVGLENFAKAWEDDFYAGRAARGPGHDKWRCELDTLLTDRAVTRVIEA